MTKALRSILITTVLCTITHLVQAQNAGGIFGRIIDAQTHEPLPGATIVVKGTTNGTVTDPTGDFSMLGLKPGETAFEITFIGYKSKVITANVEAQTLTEITVELSPDVTTLEEVEVTSQALGQAGAINQQINSSTILNVVSRDKIRELPDQNAAETVGRISGVYVQRDAGEGQKVVVRGLAPRFNNITVNGLRIPSTDPNDRSVDLSMLSPAMLSSIELYKAARPDQDGDAIGGTVNFGVRKAGEDPEILANLQTGYNSHQNEFGQYRGDISIGRRLGKEQQFGIYLSGNYQRANRSSDQLRGDYDFVSEDIFGNSLISPEELNLVDIVEVRKRYGGSLTLDYSFDQNNNISLTNLIGFTDRDEERRRRRYRWGEQRQEFEIRDRLTNTGLFSSSLNGQHKLKQKLELTWQLSYSRSTQETPAQYESRFRELSAFNSTSVDLTGQSLDTLPKLARNNLSETFLTQVSLDEDLIEDNFVTGQIDLKLPIRIGSSSGFFKTGVKLRDNQRTRERDRLVGNYFSSLSREIAFFINDFPNLYQRVPSNGAIAMSNFLTGFDAGDFLNGDYYFGPGAGEVNGPGISSSLTSSLVKNMNALNYLSRDYIADIDDYAAAERVYAAYAMTELTINPRLLILAGLRFERTQTSYDGQYMTSGIDYDDGGAFEQLTIDSTGGRDYNEFLPMVHLRYKIKPWLDIRAAVTRTISRPDFTNLIPYRRINDNEQTIDQASPLLRHTKAWNYDVSLSLYNKNGLITIGGFYKQLTDLDYRRVYTRLLPPDDPYVGYTISAPDNSAQTTTIYGGELDAQINLRSLPKPFDGLIISANATLLSSETFYPFIPQPARESAPPFTPFVVLDAFRPGKAQRQAELITNVSLGYERNGFSGRISMVYQGDTFSQTGTVSALDSYTGGNTRFDVALKQRITKYLRIYFNWNNLTNTPELSYLGDRSRRTSEDYYGYTADLGVQLQF